MSAPANQFTIDGKRAKVLPKSLLARWQRQARELEGISQEEWAERTGRRRWFIQRCEHPQAQHCQTVKDLLLGPRRGSLYVIQKIANAHGATVEDLPEPTLGDNHAARLAILVSELTDPIRAYTAALARDNEIDAQECAHLLQQVREAIAPLREFEALLVRQMGDCSSDPSREVSPPPKQDVSSASRSPQEAQ